MRGEVPLGFDGRVDPPDLADAAEHLRSWLDDVTRRSDGRLEAWHQAHAAHLIAAALALEALAAEVEG
jgi:hypothetical protein